MGEDLGPRRVDDFRAEPGAYEVIILDGGVGALEKNIDRGLAFGVALDDIVHDFGVERAVRNKDGRGIALGVAYDIIVCDLGVDAPANDDPAGDIAYGTVSRNSSVASAHKVDRERRFAPRPPFWKPRIVKPETLTSFTRFLTSKVSRFTSPK